MKRPDKDGLGFLGLGVAACAACCAGPILAFLGGLGVAGLLSTMLIGSIGLAVAAGALVAFLAVRRRRSVACSTDPEGPVPVGAPTRRT